MKKVVCGFAVCCCLGGFAGSANAAPVTFDFANNALDSSNQLTVNGYTLQVEAWTAQFNSSWVASRLGTASVTRANGLGLGVSNSAVAGAEEIDANTGIVGMQGYQDWLAFKLINPPASPVAKYVSVTYSGLDVWQGNNVGEFSQARISTKSGGVLQGGALPLGTTNSMDQLGLADDPETLILPTTFIDNEWFLLVGPRLAGIDNSGTGGAGDSFRVAAVTMDIAPVPVPGAALLLGSALLGLAGLRRKKTAVA